MRIFGSGRKTQNKNTNNNQITILGNGIINMFDFLCIVYMFSLCDSENIGLEYQTCYAKIVESPHGRNV